MCFCVFVCAFAFKCVLCEICCVMLYGVLCGAVCVVFVFFVFIMLNMCLCALGDSLCDAVGHVLCVCARCV